VDTVIYIGYIKVDLKNKYHYNMKKASKDDVIDALLLKVEQKKKEVEQIRNPVFKTNLSFPIDSYTGTRTNLNAASEEFLVTTLIWLDAMIEKNKGVPEKYGVSGISKWFGFTFEEWRDDVVLKIRQKQAMDQNKQLKEIESKLNNLMSEKKKKDIELDALKSLLEA